MNSVALSTFHSATRIQQSLLANAERKLLQFFARHMPEWVNSDDLTVLGLFGMLGAGVTYVLSQFDPAFLYLTSAFIVLNWFGDSLDGTLARFRNRQRPRYGFYVDHVVDILGTLLLLGGLAFSGLASPWTAAGLVIAYYMLFAEIGLATHALGEFRINSGWFGPTELRVLLIAANLRCVFAPTVHLFGSEWLLFDVGAICGIAGMLAIFLWRAATNTYRLYQLEKL